MRVPIIVMLAVISFFTITTITRAETVPSLEKYCACTADKLYCGLDKVGDTKPECESYLTDNGISGKTCESVHIGGECKDLEVSSLIKYCACKSDNSNCGVSKINTKQACEDILKSGNVFDRICRPVDANSPCTSLEAQYQVGGANTKYCACKSDNSNCGVSKLNTKQECEDNLKSNNVTDRICRPVEANSPCTSLEAQFQVGGAKKEITKFPISFSLPDASVLNPLGTTSPTEVLGRILSIVLGVLGTIALVMFVFAGILWMTAIGQSEQVDKAKKILIWSSFGILLILGSFGIVSFVLQAFT